LDEAGHLRLTDFGLAKAGVTGSGPEGGTRTFCGTPEYLAPEILENKGHGKAVDWWALGTLLYEMLTGLPPFYDTNVQRMYHKILHEPLRFPKAEG
jgi:serum/glucocorticoid-regulated kinase 2